MPPLPSIRKNSWILSVATGAVLCGTLDLLFAFVYYGTRFGVKPAGVLRSIAGGWLGGPAAKIGLWPVWLGGISHYFIASVIAGVFCLGSRHWPALARRAVFSGAVYGAAVYFVMNWVVLPLSASPIRAGFPKVDWIVLAAHLVFVGLPVALVAANLDRKIAPQST